MTKGSATVSLGIGNSYATVGGKSVSLAHKAATVPSDRGSYPVVALDDVSKLFSGIYTDYSDMGLMYVGGVENQLSAYTHESLIEVMKAFIYDHVDANKGKVNVFDVSKMQSLDHPYILANQSRFDAWRELYTSENPSDPVLWSYIDTIVKKADDFYLDRTGANIHSSTEYTPLKTQKYIYMPYTATNGYDPYGGRQSNAAGNADYLVNLAIAYQVSGNENYALLAYQFARQLGNWYHWGPGHFLNAADAMGPYALCYDMLYDVWSGRLAGTVYADTSEGGTEIAVDINYVRDKLFINGIMAAYYSLENINCPWARYVNGKSADASHFSTNENNWNSVCTYGVSLASLALVGDTTDITDYTLTKSTVDENGKFTFVENVNIQSIVEDYKDSSVSHTHRGFTTVQDYCEYIVGESIYDLVINGLSFYAPDGSYIESPSYWSYGTNSFFKLCSALENTVGTDYGLMNTWGMDRTCYYAINTQSSDFMMWNYHDGGSGMQSTYMLPFVAEALGLYDLAAIRKKLVAEGGGDATIYDIMYYEVGKNEEYSEPALEYHMAGIDGFTVRDSWDKGAIYAGIMGGDNDATHGQMDAGAFVYHNTGKVCFGDLGSESYNVYNFGSKGVLLGKYAYYRNSAQGNNTLTVTSAQDMLPYGQDKYGGGVMYKTYSNEFGAYALIDQTYVYSGIAKSAKRGMLFTSDRSTVVIQDEVYFNGEQTAYWFGHILEDAMVSVDGRTAYLSDGETIIRASIVSDNADLKFTLMDTYTFVVDASNGPDYSFSMNGVRENDRTGKKKLAIKCENVSEIKLAVVIEEITLGENNEIGYTYSDMDSWVPSADGRQGNETLIDIDTGAALAGKTDFTTENLTEETFDGENGFFFAGSGNGGSSVLRFEANKASILAAYNNGAVVTAELDYKYGGSTDTDIVLSGRGGEIVRVSVAELGLTADRWYRLTLIADKDGEAAYLYVDGENGIKLDLSAKSFEAISFSVITEDAVLSENDTLAIDNVTVRYFKQGYKEAKLSGMLVEGGNIKSWSDRISTYHIPTPLAAVGSEKYFRNTGIFDTPIIGFDVEFVYNGEQLAEKLDEGEIVTFLKSSEEEINISKACTVYTDGYSIVLYSDSLIMAKEGAKRVFKEGSITVSWYKEDGTLGYSEVVTASQKAVYGNGGKKVLDYGEISSTLVDEYTKEYRYYSTTGWANSVGGEALEPRDMIITADNCSFYNVKVLANDVYYAVKNSSGTTTIRKTLDNLSADFSSGVMISLARDIEVNSCFAITKNTDVHLNGYTLTFTEDTPDKPFNLRGGTLNIYGAGGRLVNRSTNATVYQQLSAVALNVQDVTFYTVGVAIDIRIGTATYKNVDFVFERSSNGFTVYNKNGRDNNVTDSTRIPTLVLDGSTVNYAKAGYSGEVATIYYNAAIKLQGGTVINLPAGEVAELINTVPGATDYYESCRYMYFEVYDATLYVAAVATYTNPAVADYPDLSAKVKLHGGAEINAPVADNQIADGCVAVKGGGDTLYTISALEDCASVTWKAGGYTLTEYWAAGSLPTPSEAAKAALGELTPATGRRYAYIAERVEAGEDVIIEAEEISEFSVKTNLSIQSDFNINIFLPADGTVSFTGFRVDGEEVEGEILQLSDGKEYYKISAKGIMPTEAVSAVSFEISFLDGAVERKLILERSVIDYVEDILSTKEEHSEESVALVANILKYVETACRYSGYLDGSYNRILRLANEYRFLFSFSPVERRTRSVSAISDGLSSVQLTLDEVPNVRFNLAEGYTGDITFSFMSEGERVVRTYKVTDGKYGGNSYIRIKLKAYDLLGDFEITTEGGEAVYSVIDYYSYFATEQGELTELLNALVSYSETAKIYRETVAK